MSSRIHDGEWREPFSWHAWRIAAWLIWIDLKQGLRKHLGGAATWQGRLLQGGGLLFALGFFVGIHLAAYCLLVFATTEAKAAPALGVERGFSTLIWFFLLFVMISGGLVRALVVLHEQDDSDLLLSSPVSPRAILAARLLGNSFQSCLVDGFIIVPWINVTTVFGGLKYLWGYPVWFVLAVMVTCLDGIFSFSLVRFFGLRQARSLAQIVPFLLVFGVTFFSAGLSMSFLQKQGQGSSHLPPGWREHLGELGQSPFGWVTRAASGDTITLLAFGVLTLGLSWLTLRWTEKPFLEGTQHLHESVAQKSGIVPPFRGNLLFLEVRKNLRLIFRTPMMFVQCLVQVLAPVGIAYLLAQSDLGKGIAFFFIFAAGVLGGIFTIAAGTVESCDDLLRMAPKPEVLFRLGKMLSGCALPILVLLITGLVLLMCQEILTAVATVAAGIPLAVSSCIAGETFSLPLKPGQRPKLLHDPIMIIPLLGIQMVSGFVAGGCVLASAFGLGYLLVTLLLSYLLMILTVGLAQLRKPLF